MLHKECVGPILGILFLCRLTVDWLLAKVQNVEEVWLNHVIWLGLAGLLLATNFSCFFANSVSFGSREGLVSE
jgi:hypothetical protein